MNQAAADQGDVTIGSFLAWGGPWALLALLIGIVVLVLAVRAARRRAPRGHALALFAAAWLPLVPALASEPLTPGWLLLRASLLWSDPGVEAIGPYLPPSVRRVATVILCAIALLLGLLGAIAALARSRVAPSEPAANGT